MNCVLTIFRSNCCPHILIISGNGVVRADEGPNNKDKSRGSG
jgi:hypothetical protein